MRKSVVIPGDIYDETLSENNNSDKNFINDFELKSPRFKHDESNLNHVVNSNLSIEKKLIYYRVALANLLSRFKKDFDGIDSTIVNTNEFDQSYINNLIETTIQKRRIVHGKTLFKFLKEHSEKSNTFEIQDNGSILIENKILRCNIVDVIHFLQSSLLKNPPVDYNLIKPYLIDLNIPQILVMNKEFKTGIKNSNKKSFNWK